MNDAQNMELLGEKNDVVMEAKNISKFYGNHQALKEVNFPIYRGRVTTLFGENGAGKSTLMKILSGIIKPTTGDIVLDGRQVIFESSSQAQENGVYIIHQELSLSPNISVRDNIFIGREIKGNFGIDYAEEERITRTLFEALEEDINPLELVENLSLGKQQLVEIARALFVNSRILIMDEPTSALSAAEVEVLFKVIRDLIHKGVSIVYISHHLEEALEITDFAVVLRDGRVTNYAPRNKIDLPWIVRNMVGDNYFIEKASYETLSDKPLLQVSNLTVHSESGNGLSKVVDNISLTLHENEVICLYGLMGSGRTELLECIAGRLKKSDGSIVFQNRNISGDNIIDRITAGLVLVPEDRQRDGLVQTMDVGTNLSLASVSEFSQLGSFQKVKKMN
ncbi:sugar ABC transporter ATP-binding protein [Photobacterium sp. GJ3]|uniref:sugar ABC transporter ATP-binding protein n=1 Tax=Photobacterium sp. GJ3 TaxID=2829502 RepID=UPI001B8D8E62|nr:sugar ABC transporter ATP-binding protein [Photobacterium sp. GJ3]QUJ66450.1 sugar ABC transporter ATP-binding protein [Photobacterium sp. GJ3]